MRKLGLAALAFLLIASVASAFEIQRHPLTGETVGTPFGGVPGGGEVNIYNYDWVPYRIEIHPHSFRIIVRHGDEGGGIYLPPGAKMTFGSPQHTWDMRGNAGSVTVGVYGGHSADVDLLPEGAGGGAVGLRVEVKSHRNRASGMIMAPENRHPDLLPPPPPVEPYQPPIPVIPQSPYPVPVIGQDPPPIPVVGIDPPSPYWSGPHMAPPPPPPPPHYYRHHHRGW